MCLRIDQKLEKLIRFSVVLWLVATPLVAYGQSSNSGKAVMLNAPVTIATDETYNESSPAEEPFPDAPFPTDIPTLAQERLSLAYAPGPQSAEPTPAASTAPVPAPAPIASVSEPQAAPVVGAVQVQSWNQSVSPFRCAVACPACPENGKPGWEAMQPIPWQVLAHGEYIGPARTAHVPEYYLRVDDIMRFVFGLTAGPSPQPYRFDVGDVIRIESVGSSKLDREVLIQPDGAVTLLLLGQVPAAGLTIEQFRDRLEQEYAQFVKDPQVSVTPVKINTRVEELRMSVDERYGKGGQGVTVRVTPAGTVQLPVIGSVPVQGLTLYEVEREVEARYAQRFQGVDVTPVLEARAPRFVFVLGEVRVPGRYELTGPTTVMQAIALAGSWNVGAKLKQVVVFRRDACWGLMATKLDLHQGLFGKEPCPVDEIWLRDSDLVLVPKGSLLASDDWINLVFTRGIYGVVPFNFSAALTGVGTL